MHSDRDCRKRLCQRSKYPHCPKSISAADEGSVKHQSKIHITYIGGQTT